MSFTDEEFERLEKEISTLFLAPPVRLKADDADQRRVDSILQRLEDSNSEHEGKEALQSDAD